MAWNIIVASSDADQLDELLNGAQEIASGLVPRGVVRIAMSVEEVSQKRHPGSSETELLIVAASLPQHRSSSDDSREPGLNLVKLVDGETRPPACILVSDRVEHYRAVQSIKRCEWLAVDGSTDYVSQCLQLARRLGVISEDPDPGRSQGPLRIGANAPPILVMENPGGILAAMPTGKPRLLESTARPPESITYALLEVDLPSDAKLATVRLEIHEPGRIERKEAQPLRLKGTKIDQLMEECKDLKNKLSGSVRWKQYYGQWHADYRKLGERLSSLLWGSAWFKEYYHYGSGAAKKNVRVRFNLQQPWFGGFWEAISFDSGERRLVMLENTVTRRALGDNQVGVFADETGQIDAEDGALNVLVIKSNVSGDSTPDGPDDLLWNKCWASYDGKLSELVHLDDEVEVLRDLKRLAKRKNADGGKKFVIHVDVLPRVQPAADKTWSLADIVERWLKKGSRRYDIVHFAGHALFDDSPKQDERGYLVFSGSPYPQAVPISIVATWLAKAGVQFVYLSCCRSSAASAAQEFARNNIPMALGFHWDLNDSKAPVFAERFYAELLEANLKVCRAFSKARLELYNKHLAGDPIWASPVLIAQPMNWIQVEGALKLAAQERKNRPAERQPRPKPAPVGRSGAEAAA
jgi:hypothetical protein